MGGPPELTSALRTLAARTETIRRRYRVHESVLSFHIGRISRVAEQYVVVTNERGASLAVPRGLARAAHRERLGECLGIVNTPVGDREMIVRAVPGLELHRAGGESYSPFARPGGVERISEAEAAYLRGIPVPLTVRIPVAIEA